MFIMSATNDAEYPEAKAVVKFGFNIKRLAIIGGSILTAVALIFSAASGTPKHKKAALKIMDTMTTPEYEQSIARNKTEMNPAMMQQASSEQSLMPTSANGQGGLDPSKIPGSAAFNQNNYPSAQRPGMNAQESGSEGDLENNPPQYSRGGGHAGSSFGGGSRPRPVLFRVMS